MDIRATVGRPGRLVWMAPMHITEAPTLTIKASGGDVSPALTVARAAVSVKTVANDRKTLTLTAAVGAPVDPVVADHGDAYLVLPDGEALEVTVLRIDGDVLRLADDIRRPVSGVADDNLATLHWASYVATIPDSVTEAAARNIPWIVAAAGRGPLGNVPIDDRGLLHVVKDPFSTGVTVHSLHRSKPWLADRQYRRTSHRQAVQDAFDQLIIWIRQGLPDGVWEDDVFSGHELRLVHLDLAEAMIAEDPESRRGFENAARAKFKMIADRVAVDTKKAGKPDDDPVDLTSTDAVDFDWGGMTTDTLTSTSA